MLFWILSQFLHLASTHHLLLPESISNLHSHIICICLHEISSPSSTVTGTHQPKPAQLTISDANTVTQSHRHTHTYHVEPLMGDWWVTFLGVGWTVWVLRWGWWGHFAAAGELITPIRSIFHYAVSLCVVVSPYMCCDVSVEHQTLPVSIFFPWERQIKRIDSVMD